MSDNLSVAAMKGALSAPAERGAFSLFPKLPLELRRMIWLASCCSNQPRLIYISERVFDEWWHGLVARYQVPSQLQASQESRECALQFYDFAFGSQMKGTSIYFNFATDALVFANFQALYGFINLWVNDDNEIDPAETPLDKKVLAFAVLDPYWCCSSRYTQATEALGNPEYMQIITRDSGLGDLHPRMGGYYQLEWLRQNPRRRDGYLGPIVSYSTIEQFQTMLNILHNPKLAPKPEDISAPTRRSARLQGKAPSS